MIWIAHRDTCDCPGHQAFSSARKTVRHYCRSFELAIQPRAAALHSTGLLSAVDTLGAIGLDLATTRAVR